MAEVPPMPVATEDDLARWYKLKEQLASLKASEMLLRKFIFNSWFKEQEGTQTHDITGGFVCKGSMDFNYKVDEATFQTLREKFIEEGIQEPDKLVRWKPELNKANYNQLTAEQRAFFDQCITITPGSPTLEITQPKPKGKPKAPPTVAPKGQENL